MYTIPLPDGTRDLRVEHGLSQLERGLIQLRTDFVERRRQIPVHRFVRFVAFIAAMHGRTKAFRDHQREQWQGILNVMNEVEANMAKKTPEERKRIASLQVPSSGKNSMTREDVTQLAEMPVQLLMPSVLKAEVPILGQMVMTIYCTDLEPGFITSDNPVVWFDPEAYERPLMFRAPSLMSETVEITMPLSPRHLVAIHHDQPISRGIKPVQYVDAWPETVRSMNRRTAAAALEFVVSCRDGYDPDWNLENASQG